MSVVQQIASAEDIRTSNPTAFGTGTNLVVDLDGRSVLKLFPPVYRTQFVSERATLRQLAGRLSVTIPSILAEGERDGWSWLIMTKVEGIVGSEAWPRLSEHQKEQILRQIGRAIAEVQASPLGELAAIEPVWPDFLARQIEGCIERHRGQGLAPRFLSDLSKLLADAPAVVPQDASPVILTGEWIPENVLLSEYDGHWTLTGVIDFGDVMTGWREYDLLGPSAFMCAGRPRRVQSLLEGYGVSVMDCDHAMRRRLLTLMLLHRASDLRNVRIDGWEGRVESLFDLENLLWNTEEGVERR